MSTILLLLQSVHESVHDFTMKLQFSEPKIFTGGVGRKVEKALQMRKEGHTIVMIHEFDFFDIIDDLS